jgi:hypothetical protein
MKKLRAKIALLVVVGLLCVCLGTATATPYFGINTAAEWQQALNTGKIKAVPAATFRAMVDPTNTNSPWPAEYKNAEFFTPTLYVYDNYEGEAGLVMTWGNPTLPPETRQAAAWDYEYTLDPNLNGTTIELSIFPPVPSTLVSLNIIDANGNYREWIWHAGNPGELIPGRWNTLVLNPVSGASNFLTTGGSPFIGPDPSNPHFDLSTVKFLRFNENISAAFPNWPPGPAGVPAGWMWNMWDHVEVTPEPGTMVLLGGGLLALLRRRRRNG